MNNLWKDVGKGVYLNNLILVEMKKDKEIPSQIIRPNFHSVLGHYDLVNDYFMLLERHRQIISH